MNLDDMARNFFIKYLLFFCLLLLSTIGRTQEYELSFAHSPTTIKKFESLKQLNEFYQDSINQLYQKGYLQLEYSPLQRTDSLRFIGTIIPNKRFETLELHFTKNKKSDLQLLEINTPNRHIAWDSIEPFIQEKLHLLESKGYPLSAIQIENHHWKNDQLHANFIAKIDTLRFIDQIVVLPYQKFPKNIQRNFLNQTRKHPFSNEQIAYAKDYFSQFPFIETTQNPQILFEKEKTTLYIYAKRKNTNTIDALLGASSDPITNKLQLNGHINIQLQNMLRKGENLALYWKNNGQQKSDFSLQTTFPFLLGSDFGINASFAIHKQDSTYQNRTLLGSLFYQPTPKSKWAIGIENRHSNVLYESPSQKSFQTNNYFGAYTYKAHHTQEIFNTGWFLDGKISIGNRSLKDQNTSQWSLQINAEKLWKLHPRHYIRQQIESYYLHSGFYLENELPFFGGSHSIRGFIENSIYANQFVGLYTDYRFVLSPQLYIHTITDIGYYTHSPSDTKAFQYTIGAGIGVRTGSGWLHLQYAAGNTQNQPFTFKNSRVHISFQTYF